MNFEGTYAIIHLSNWSIQKDTGNEVRSGKDIYMIVGDRYRLIHGGERITKSDGEEYEEE